jgi:hypothetical protein
VHGAAVEHALFIGPLLASRLIEAMASARDALQPAT